MHKKATQWVAFLFVTNRCGRPCKAEQQWRQSTVLMLIACVPLGTRRCFELNGLPRFQALVPISHYL